VRTVVARHTVGRPPAVRAHTVAELLAGVQPDLADADSIPLSVS
jgi:hypothetical protein